MLLVLNEDSTLPLAICRSTQKLLAAHLLNLTNSIVSQEHLAESPTPSKRPEAKMEDVLGVSIISDPGQDAGYESVPAFDTL